MTDRREFLRKSSLIALAPTLPGFLQQTARAAPESADRILVVVQLDGGNDGINTLVPVSDEGYEQHRQTLRLPKDRLLKTDGKVGLHPAMRPMADLLEDGRLAIVQGVGYPNPNRSHDVSMATWHTGRLSEDDHQSWGWIGRALDETPRNGGQTASSVFVGERAIPRAVIGRRSVVLSFESLNDLTLLNDRARDMPPAADKSDESLTAFIERVSVDARVMTEKLKDAARQPASDNYPSGRLAQHLSLIARLIRTDFPTSVYYAIQPGYDTHSVQLPLQARLLRELSRSLFAFLEDLKESGLDDRVLVLCFSEFGRRVEENDSAGTDHGTAGPVFLAGKPVKAGLHGDAPSLTDLEDGDLKFGIDFRDVYASLLSRWLQISPDSGQEKLDLF